MQELLDPGTITNSISLASIALNHPIVKDLLKQAAHGAAVEVGKQTLITATKTVRNLMDSVMLGMKTMLGHESLAVQRLELLQMDPEQEQEAVKTLSHEINLLSKRMTATELEDLLTKTEELQKETQELYRQIEEYQSNCIVTQGSYSPVTTGDNSPITIENAIHNPNSEFQGPVHQGSGDQHNYFGCSPNSEKKRTCRERVSAKVTQYVFYRADGIIRNAEMWFSR